MKTLLPLLFFCTSIALASGQDRNAYLDHSDSDPGAKKLLEKMRQKFDKYSSLKATFTLTLQFPEEPEEIQEGKMAQKGDMYRVEMPQQSIMSDGKSIWFYQADINEVQVNSAEEVDEEDMMSPKDLLQIYEKEEYVSVLGNAYTENGRAIQEIEFKPLDRNSEYSKLRLKMDKKALEPLRILVFSKDGSRYVLDLKSLTPNPSLTDNYFVFNPKDYPGVIVEDLRID